MNKLTQDRSRASPNLGSQKQSEQSAVVLNVVDLAGFHGLRRNIVSNPSTGKRAESAEPGRKVARNVGGKAQINICRELERYVVKIDP